ncbi:hypothetical protein M407DRAFT_242648 [Tulasnella calospora MUT 4182]|uniref:Uncharacterized protein n=1 Tax=Tulasnella calospora MUT 4182 TaxID=1051891 RepID=A0A0C3QPV0_9AGAM|nr:hypothetical protein M407DRAFT_242648 [Tulasnella calospora MUT 4182]
MILQYPFVRGSDDPSIYPILLFTPQLEARGFRRQFVSLLSATKYSAEGREILCFCFSCLTYL